MDTAPVLQLENVHFSYDRQKVLNGVSLTVEKTQVLCVIGRSGCGKSTLLKLVAGLEFPSLGRILMNGADATTIEAHKRDIGYVFQTELALFPHLTVRENIEFPFKHGRRIVRVADTHEAVNNVLALTGLTAHSTKRPYQLSGGMKQRLAIARAVVYEPSLLLLDEPLRSLDNITRTDLFTLLRELHERGDTTMLYVTHDDREVMKLATHIAVLHQGAITHNCPVEEAGTIEDQIARQLLGLDESGL